MNLGEVFERVVTRNIPPVVYFHEQDGQRLADEVAEYIITGGYAEGDPRRNAAGIHEQYVRLLTAMVKELSRAGGPELPAAWISGFYGSGKSSFAKLLGLALDAAKLPDGRLLSDALWERDKSPDKDALVKAWGRLLEKVKPIAVVFDIGGVAVDGEHIHSAVRRLVQRRLGYSTNALVADAELRLEQDGEWEKFLAAAKTALGGEWKDFRNQTRADEHFSHAMHAFEPEKYPEPMSWWDSRAGTSMSAGLSVSDTVRNLGAMLDRHAEGRTLFLVVDEVSQYVHQSDERMLRLQSFVSELGQRLKGRVWLLATGQQKLEEAGASSPLGKLKDRFPPSLRVHLAPNNIRDVVHRRLLAKDPKKDKPLRELYARHSAQLKLHGYKCESLTEEEFLETYPLLPRHVELLMELTTELRMRSARSQGDDYAIRGLLQLLGELFREKKLGDDPLGRLVTLDDIYDLQASAFDAEAQVTMSRVLAMPELTRDVWARRAVKAIALLELNYEREPVREELIASCLYAHLGDPNPLTGLKPALEKLTGLNVIGYSEKEGYKLQSSAGQEWQSERSALSVGPDERNKLVREKLVELMKAPERPKLNSVPFAWAAFMSDGRAIADQRLSGGGDDAAVTMDFRLPLRGRSTDDWAAISADKSLENRILWVAADPDEEVLKELGRSRQMLAKYQPRRGSIGGEKKKLLFMEEDRKETLETQAAKQVEAAFLAGRICFRGRLEDARTLGGTFNAVMTAAATARLPQLYAHHIAIAFTERELEQLLQGQLSGVSPKFLDPGLGLLTQEGSRYAPTCHGAVPKLIEEYVERNDGTSGAVLLQDFARPPYGFPTDVVRACVLGLLRARRVSLTAEDGTKLSSPVDPGARELFQSVARFKRSTISRVTSTAITQRDLTAMGRFFSERLNDEVEREPEALADAVFKHFPALRERLRIVELRFARLPGRPDLDPRLQRLATALEQCRAHRKVDETVRSLKTHLPVLIEGVPLMQSLHSDLGDEQLNGVLAAASVRDFQAAQLEREGATANVTVELEQLKQQLQSPQPWRDIASLAGALQRIEAEYSTRRSEVLNLQEVMSEHAKDQLRRREGFVRLTEEEAHRVLRPITAALRSTTPEAVAPSLHELRVDFEAALRRAVDDASALLDELLAAKDDKPVVRVELNLRNREVATRAELDTVLDEVRTRVGEQLDKGHKVRLG